MPMLALCRMRPRRPAGYTLLEILFVLLLVGLVGGVVVPRVNVIYDNLVLRSDRERLLRAIELLPMDAYARRNPISINTDIQRAAELLNIPPDWSVLFSQGLTYRANGLCTGGGVSLVHVSERRWDYRLAPPYCRPVQLEEEG